MSYVYDIVYYVVYFCIWYSIWYYVVCCLQYMYIYHIYSATGTLPQDQGWPQDECYRHHYQARQCLDIHLLKPARFGWHWADIATAEAAPGNQPAGFDPQSLPTRGRWFGSRASHSPSPNTGWAWVTSNGYWVTVKVKPGLRASCSTWISLWLRLRTPCLRSDWSSGFNLDLGPPVVLRLTRRGLQCRPGCRLLRTLWCYVAVITRAIKVCLLAHECLGVISWEDVKKFLQWSLETREVLAVDFRRRISRWWQHLSEIS